jgi:hypothetical protein
MEIPTWPNEDDEWAINDRLSIENQELRNAIKQAVTLIMQGAHTEARLVLEKSL